MSWFRAAVHFRYEGCNCRFWKTSRTEGRHKVQASVDPMFLAGLPFPVPEILEFIAFLDSGRFFQLFSRNFRNFPAELPKDPRNSHGPFEFLFFSSWNNKRFLPNFRLRNLKIQGLKKCDSMPTAIPCDSEVALQTPKPRKTQTHEKVAQKWLSGPRWVGSKTKGPGEKGAPRNHPETSSQIGRRILGQYPAAPSSPGPFVLLLSESDSKSSQEWPKSDFSTDKR